MRFSERVLGQPVCHVKAWLGGVVLQFCAISSAKRGRSRAGLAVAALCLFSIVLLTAHAQTPPVETNATKPKRLDLPPRVVEAQRFLAQRGWTPGRRVRRATAAPGAKTQPPASGIWLPLGPDAVLTPAWGLVSGRVSALALDPADATGNHLYLGTTGGGVWMTNNAAVTDAGKVVFTPLTDAVEALSGAMDASISIGAVTVQPGGTGVILAGTGDPNDALDSYYGAGILRSADGGNSWTLISETADFKWKFTGEGFAGFAWSSVNSQLVVAAVSQAYEGTLVNAVAENNSYEGLYYSSDAGATWNLATIADAAGAVVQGPGGEFAAPDGNAATAVVWNPVRQIFVAAVRFHGYYQSSDGINWVRMAAQPGANLTAANCPTNAGQTGSTGCPIFRGTLAVNPQTGDTFAWTVDEFNQDQGLWQDQCAITGGACDSPNVAFARQWNTQALESSTSEGVATIANGDYNLALAAVPAGLGQGEDTRLLAGANDLWKCSLTQGCAWRNTTNATTCMSAQVAEYQHALEWSAGNPLEIFVGNDSGLWRSLDAIGETGPACATTAATDATHFQNLNGGLGSLSEVVSMAVTSPFSMMTGLGVNGTAGLKSNTAVTAEWPQILGGYGGPVAIDPKHEENWYVNNQDGVAIYFCSDPTTCNPAAFGSSPVVNNADVGGDGNTMASPAPFLVDPVDPTQLLIATCRVWRGPASGAGWSGSNAISPILDSGELGASCNGDALIRSIDAMPLSGGDEAVYVGTYGLLDGGQTLPGHVLSAIVNTQSAAMPAWQDLTLNPVSNSADALNKFGFDISSIYIDSHDPTGNTVYVTVEGFPTEFVNVETVYGSTDGGADWVNLTADLPSAPVSSLVVDPQSAGTVYVATDVGVYFTTQISSCASVASICWSAFGSGLPDAPVVELSVPLATAPAQVLTAGTYGRGLWQTPLWTGGAGAGPPTDSLNPGSIAFPATAVGQLSAPMPVVLTNSGGMPLTSIAVSTSGAFQTSNNCGTQLAGSAACTIEVTFAPMQIGSQAGMLTVADALRAHPQTVALTGTGARPAALSVNPTSLTFGSQSLGGSSAPTILTIGDTGGVAAANVGFQFSGASAGGFSTGTTTCAAMLIAGSNCTVQVIFTPVAAGGNSATLTVSSATPGVTPVTVPLSGAGNAVSGLNVSPAEVTFAATLVASSSAAQTVTVSNTSSVPASQLSLTVTNGFALAQNTCAGSLEAGASCTVGVLFDPTATGIEAGTLTVSSASIGNIAIVELGGTGAVAAAIQVAPATILPFATTDVGQTSSPVAFTVTNTGIATALSNLALAVPAGFQLVNDTCAATLGPGMSCTAGVEFAPTAAGSQTGNLTVTSSSAANAVSIPLQGMGFDFMVTISGSSTQSVAEGLTADYSLTLKPLAGSSASFTFACSSLPANAICSFNPSTVPLSSGATGNLTVAVSTGSSTAADQLQRPRAWGILPFVCGLLLLPCGSKRHRKVWFSALLLAMMAGGVSSCIVSGGGTGGGGHDIPGTTPAGTYSIVVTVTANGLSHSTPITLTVD
jgi:hypothetical protein